MNPYQAPQSPETVNSCDNFLLWIALEMFTATLLWGAVTVVLIEAMADQATVDYAKHCLEWCMLGTFASGIAGFVYEGFRRDPS